MKDTLLGQALKVFMAEFMYSALKVKKAREITLGKSTNTAKPIKKINKNSLSK
jgi:hypothetical protein